MEYTFVAPANQMLVISVAMRSYLRARFVRSTFRPSSSTAEDSSRLRFDPVETDVCGVRHSRRSRAIDRRSTDRLENAFLQAVPQRREAGSLRNLYVAESLGHPGRSDGRLSVAPVQLLDERPERAAPRASPEPASGGRPALAATELDDDLGHAAMIRRRPDGRRLS